MEIRDYKLKFYHLSPRDNTDIIVLHHTGADMDATARQIHQWHLERGWTGIGYHFVIRKDGTLELGRPEWAIGAHAQGHNYNSIGIHLSGNFDQTRPTEAQLDTLSELLDELAADYHIPFDRRHILGHCELMPTECPGQHLLAALDELVEA